MVLQEANMEGFPTAKEAREKLFTEGEDLKFFLERIKHRIDEAIEEGRTEIYFGLEGNNQLMYEKLANYLREKGYDVYWNKACYWMEISWSGT
jgi:hypothetical protein